MLYDDVRVDKVHDGDTLMLLINVFVKKMYYFGYCRLANVWCPELSSGEAGQIAKEALQNMIAGRKLRVEVKSVDMYGRPLVQITYLYGRKKEEVNVNQLLIDKGYAKKKSLKWQCSNPKNDLPKGNFVGLTKDLKGATVLRDFEKVIQKADGKGEDQKAIRESKKDQDRPESEASGVHEADR